MLLKAHIEQLTAAWKIDLIKFSEVVWGSAFLIAGI